MSVDQQADFDPYSEETIKNFVEVTADLRARCPVMRTDEGWYMVTKYDEVREVLGTPGLWSNEQGIHREPNADGGLLGTDAPEHNIQRRIVGRRFSRKMVEQYRGLIEDVANDMIDEFADRGKVDLYADFTHLFPATVFGLVMGLGVEDAPKLRYFSDAFISETIGDSVDFRAEAAEYFGRALDTRLEQLARGEQTTDDVLSDLALGEHQGLVTRPDVLEMINHIVTGGTDTTAFQICSMLFRVMTRPGLLDRLRAEPDLWDAAIEESVRMDSSAVGLFRTPKTDTELAGVEIPQDTKTRVSYSSANRDADAFTNPDEFDIDRPEEELRQHVGFGHGAHRCLGQYFARLEMRVAVEVLLKRLPNVHLDGDVQWYNSFNIQGVKYLPLAWDLPAGSR